MFRGIPWHGIPCSSEFRITDFRGNGIPYHGILRNPNSAELRNSVTSCDGIPGENSDGIPRNSSGHPNGSKVIFINFTMEVSMYKFINMLILFFTIETVRSITLDKVFVKQSFYNFIFKHGYKCALFQFKRKIIPNIKKKMFARN